LERKLVAREEGQRKIRQGKTSKRFVYSCRKRKDEGRAKAESKSRGTNAEKQFGNNKEVKVSNGAQ
jgi:hypothetical protein